MTDQMYRDIAALIIIGAALIILGTGHALDPMIKEWADIAFGFLFGAKTATYTMGRMNGNTSTTTSTEVTQAQTTSPTEVPKP